MTAVDVLMHSRRDVRDPEIEVSLKQARGFGSNRETNNNTPLINRKNQNKNSSGGLMKQHSEWLEHTKSTLMIVAILIATIAFQIGANPPGGLWEEDQILDPQGKPVSDPHHAGESIMARNYPVGYGRFYISNTIALVASLSIILFLISGLPLRRNVFMWILMVITWIAITAIALCYALAVAMVTPDPNLSIDEGARRARMPIVKVIDIMIYAWTLLMALLLIAHTIRMIKKLKLFMRRRSFAAAASQENGKNDIAAV
ncbi:hypothetical protein C2S53_012250 [Perilla frutescens var. hirtella]|uniref:PGG domain-containing protein n=1 Tax=Perilla frutescens var. hirtella TaxID=608512 RepID=A0AAD4J351_PERFH|nr:hypothetical protein C2S53_012250 [Perilla frutescens var. hirtella]